MKHPTAEVCRSADFSANWLHLIQPQNISDSSYFKIEKALCISQVLKSNHESHTLQDITGRWRGLLFFFVFFCLQVNQDRLVSSQQKSS